MSKKGLLAAIEKVRRMIKSGDERYVCYAARKTVYESEIKTMVKMHIGDDHTMSTFLDDKFGEWPDTDVARSYRNAMLNSMRDMVLKGEFE